MNNQYWLDYNIKLTWFEPCLSREFTKLTQSKNKRLNVHNIDWIVIKIDSICATFDSTVHEINSMCLLSYLIHWFYFDPLAIEFICLHASWPVEEWRAKQNLQVHLKISCTLGPFHLYIKACKKKELILHAFYKYRPQKYLVVLVHNTLYPAEQQCISYQLKVTSRQ